jgi:hypothetical protein
VIIARVKVGNPRDALVGLNWLFRSRRNRRTGSVVVSSRLKGGTETHSELISWSFTEIAATDPSRASVLEGAPSARAILGAVVSKLVEAAKTGRLCVGAEQAAREPGDQRVVLQFHVGEKLFDQFFNARTGYRAQFRRGWQTGLSYNRELIETMRDSVVSVLPSEVCISSPHPVRCRFDDEVTFEATTAT